MKIRRKTLHESCKRIQELVYAKTGSFLSGDDIDALHECLSFDMASGGLMPTAFEIEVLVLDAEPGLEHRFPHTHAFLELLH